MSDLPALDWSKVNELELRAFALGMALRNNSVVRPCGCGIDYLPDLAEDVYRFMKGEYVPFDERVTEQTVTGQVDNVVFVDFGKKDQPDE